MNYFGIFCLFTLFAFNKVSANGDLTGIADCDQRGNIIICENADEHFDPKDQEITLRFVLSENIAM